MNVLMPQLGETVSEGKIVKWFKAVGDSVAAGENLYEVETDKVTVWIPAIAGGVLQSIDVAAGIVATVGARMASGISGRRSLRRTDPVLAAEPLDAFRHFVENPLRMIA